MPPGRGNAYEEYWKQNFGWHVYTLVMACSLGLACTLLIGVVWAIPGRADVGVQPILPGGSSIKPEGGTPIQMAAEKVAMTLRHGTEAENAAYQLDPEAGYPWLSSPYFPIVYLAVADVTADFTMVNPTNEAVNMTVWFPLASALESARWDEHIGESAPRIENFQVVIDGQQLDYTLTELPNPQGEDKPPIPWASFPVTFPAGQEVLIQVRYVFVPQPSAVDGVGMTLHYIFQTGAGWTGPIGQGGAGVNLLTRRSAETIGTMPEGGQVEGQQVHWTWEDLEPGPQDDFFILLLRPERWEELRYWKEIVKDQPDYGQGWLMLATVYERLSQGVWERGHIIPGFGDTYQRLGVQAAQEAARLLPGDIGPHYELAMLYSAALLQNPPLEMLQPVWDELQIMRELNPEEAQALEPNVYDILEPVLYNDATATAEWAAWSTGWAKETIAATLYNDATATAEAVSWACLATANAECTPTPSPSVTPKPSAKPQSVPTVTAPVATNGGGRVMIIGAIAVLVVLLFFGILAVRRTGGGASRW